MGCDRQDCRDGATQCGKPRWSGPVRCAAMGRAGQERRDGMSRLDIGCRDGLGRSGVPRCIGAERHGSPRWCGRGWNVTMEREGPAGHDVAVCIGPPRWGDLGWAGRPRWVVTERIATMGRRATGRKAPMVRRGSDCPNGRGRAGMPRWVGKVGLAAMRGLGMRGLGMRCRNESAGRGLDRLNVADWNGVSRCSSPAECAAMEWGRVGRITAMARLGEECRDGLGCAA